MITVALARNAMASRFEIVLFGEDAVRLRAAGEEALSEVGRIEDQLSLYRPSSEISHVNARAASEYVKVSPPVFALLRRARQLWEETAGAFDITMGPLIKAWGFMGDVPRTPSRSELDHILESTGLQHLELRDSDGAVRFRRPGMMIDLGAIGKGYAVEEAAEILSEAGVETALIHGGTSTVFGLGAPPETDGWRVALESPSQYENAKTQTTDSIVRLQGSAQSPRKEAENRPTVGEVVLHNEALSVSSPGGKFFMTGNTVYGHVIDPRTGEPARSAAMAVVVTPSATDSDALSTALLILGSEGVSRLRSKRPNIRTILTPP